MTVKSRVLSLLSEREGTFVGGEEMAESFGCSRTAIWKAVSLLREEGHCIETAPKQGYRLVGRLMAPSEDGIRLWLCQKEAPVRVYPSLKSTNQTAKEAYVLGQAPHGTLVLAREQTQGRGRRGKIFYSPEGAGLYFSVVLRPDCGLSQALSLTTAAATAVYRAVKSLLGISLSIKWVNDLYLEGKKVGGILTEAVTDFESGGIEAAIVGIGLNLFPPREGYPKELKGRAGALFPDEEGASGLDEGHLVALICNELLELCQSPEVSPDYIAQNLVPGRTIWVRTGAPLQGGGKKGAPAGQENGPGQPPDGYEQVAALSIQRDGALLVRKGDGREEALYYGEILLGPEGNVSERDG